MDQSNLHKVIVISYSVIAFLFITFFLYMYLFENSSVYNARETGTYQIVDNYTETKIPDPIAPIGTRREFRWSLDSFEGNDATLFFYLVHSYAEVYFDDELMYSIMPNKSGKIGKSVSSNWIMVPLYPKDVGREVRIIVTPVYESVSDRKIEFEIGSFFEIYRRLLAEDFYQLILSVLCLGLGFFSMVVWIILVILHKVQGFQIFYLGNFSVLLGLWKITDTRFSPLLFERNPMALGYITIGALFLGVIPFSLYMKEKFDDYKTNYILISSLISTIVASIVLFCQVFGVLDFRESLPLGHMTIIFTSCMIAVTALKRKLNYATTYTSKTWKYIILFSSGAIADLVIMYVNCSSSGLIFTILAFIIYLISLFFENIQKINQKAYTDARTGLFNRRRWEELMNDSVMVPLPIGMVMLDLNGLKGINDTMGHKFGDKLIYNFANILRNNIPDTDILCRWGGDEFTVMITNTNEVYIKNLLSDIAAAVERYNSSGKKPAIYYAAGYALSSEFPQLSRRELLEKADERMYENKQQWYDDKHKTNVRI